MTQKLFNKLTNVKTQMHGHKSNDDFKDDLDNIARALSMTNESLFNAEVWVRVKSFDITNGRKANKLKFTYEVWYNSRLYEVEGGQFGTGNAPSDSRLETITLAPNEYIKKIDGTYGTEYNGKWWTITLVVTTAFYGENKERVRNFGSDPFRDSFSSLPAMNVSYSRSAGNLHSLGAYRAEEHNFKLIDTQSGIIQPSPSQPVIQPQPNLPTDYQQIKDELTKWTNALGKEKPEEIKKQVELLKLLQPELADYKQKYGDSQTELNSTKNDLAAERAKTHALDLKVNDLSNEVTRNNDRITELEKRPNISSEDWIKDYSQRPTVEELNQLKEERDQRPAITLTDYQKLVETKDQLENWTKVLPDKLPQEVKVQMDQLQKDIKDWTDKFTGQNPEQVFSRINYLNSNQERHTTSDLKPVDLPSNWKEQLNRLSSLEKRPDIPITETQWNADYSKRPTLQEFERVKDELNALNRIKLDFDNLKKRILKYKIDTINKNWISLTNRLEVTWLEVDNLYKSYGKDLDDLINRNLSLANLENDSLFEMAEDTVKRIIFSVASQKADQKSEEAKKDTNLTHGKIAELIKLFDRLIDVSLGELKDVNMLNNPFYLSLVEQKLNLAKSHNSNQLNFWKKSLNWDKTTTTRVLQADTTTESWIEYPEQK